MVTQQVASYTRAQTFRADRGTNTPHVPRPRHAKLAPVEHGQRKHLAHVADIRSRYDDGVPLAGEDARFMFAVLTNHPRAAEKIGAGVRAIVVHRYIGGTRCFWVIRKDGSAVDFSASYAITKHHNPTTPQARSAMAAWRPAVIVAAWNRALQALRGQR